MCARRRIRLEENHVKQMGEIKTLELAMERARGDQQVRICISQIPSTLFAHTMY